MSYARHFILYKVLVQPRWTGKRRVMAAKMLAAMQNINKTNKIDSKKKQKRHSSLIFAAVVCVYWYTGLPLVCYVEHIRALKMVSMKIFFQIMFVWQENDLVFIIALNSIK